MLGHAGPLRLPGMVPAGHATRAAGKVTQPRRAGEHAGGRAGGHTGGGGEGEGEGARASCTAGALVHTTPGCCRRGDARQPAPCVRRRLQLAWCDCLRAPHHNRFYSPCPCCRRSHRCVRAPQRRCRHALRRGRPRPVRSLPSHGTGAVAALPGSRQPHTRRTQRLAGGGGGAGLTRRALWRLHCCNAAPDARSAWPAAAARLA